ncbi:MAG TPA: hypothetical protein VNP95_00660 [Thermomicrobiales bacterium]|nr:hypothetical protein [Thermomicrobiales bacterium]
MTLWTNLYLIHDVPDDVISHALAAAFSLNSDTITVEAPGIHSANAPSGIVVIRDDFRWQLPETRFPIELTVVLPDAMAIGDQETPRYLSRIARHLDVPFLVSIPSDDQDTSRLALPSGELLPREDDDDGDIVYEPGDAERLAPYLPKDALPLAS